MKRTSAPAPWVGLLLTTCWLAGAPANAQTEEQIRVVSDAVEVGIGGRLQTQFNTSSVDNVPESELFIRRARLELSVKVNELVSGRVHPEFAGDRVSLRDVYLQLGFTPGLQLRAGKFHRPFGLLEQTSSTRILPIERGLAIRGVDDWDEYALVHDLKYADRDIGVQAMGSPEGAPLGLSYSAAIFRGPAHHVGSDATYQYVARTTVAPVDGVRIGAGWSNRAFSRALTAPEGGFEIRRGSAYEVDLEIGSFAPGFHMLGELAAGKFDPFSDRDFLGAQAWLAYRTGSMGRIFAVEPTFRASYGDVDVAATATPARGGTLLTPGLNVYMGGRNRVMFNYDLWLAGGDASDQGSFKVMFQLAF